MAGRREPARRTRGGAAAAPPSWPEVRGALEAVAPLELAAEWDNVGLVLEPRPLRGPIARVVLTIDLTTAVVAEASRLRADLVVAYHPPVFRGLKRLCASDPQQGAVLAALHAGLPVYSPHTALDGADGGIAEWLAHGVAKDHGIRDLRPCREGVHGRVFALERPAPLAALMAVIRRHLGVGDLRVAAPKSLARHRVRTVAVAAGSGGSLLRGERVDLWLTGEMSHHEGLAALRQGTAVVLAEHSNTERGYLQVLRQRLRTALGKGVDVRVAKTDADPFVHHAAPAR